MHVFLAGENNAFSESWIILCCIIRALRTLLFSVQVNVSSAVLKAAAHHYGSQCDKANKEFMLCRWEEKDPRKCLKEGRKVNECALNFFRYSTLLPVCPDFASESFRYVLSFITSTLYLWSKMHTYFFVSKLEIPLDFNSQYLSFSDISLGSFSRC